jgi:hypothetical protein
MRKMTADKPALGQKASEAHSREVGTAEPSLIHRALLRASVYAGLIALSILLWWAIIRLFLRS